MHSQIVFDILNVIILILFVTEVCFYQINNGIMHFPPSTGLQIIFNLDEVSFIQNLVFYIESAYCVPVSLILHTSFQFIEV